MTRLNLSPLPRIYRDDSVSEQTGDQVGFVDDEVVTALLTGPSLPRNSPVAEDLVLAADQDFAGWCLSTAHSPAMPEESPVVREPAIRRPAPPVLEEPGIGASHRGSPRWWMAALAGILLTTLTCLLLFSLSARNLPADSNVGSPQVPANPAPAFNAAHSPPPPAPELTDAD